MKVKLEHLGWQAPLPGNEIYTSEGWHRYLCIAANGIVAYYNTIDYVPDGEYELKDEDWSYDNPRFDEDIECEKIEVA